MCGRFTLTATPEALNQLFPLFDNIELEPQYNIAPTNNVLAVRLKLGTDQPEAVRLRWGLIPSWADDIKIGYKLINARAETARTKPSFRSAFKHRHCLVLADGFYEWKKAGKTKQPFHIRLRDGRPFAFAGLWETWDHDGQAIESCTILTTESNEAVRPLHERMPVILEPKNLQKWLVANDDQQTADSCLTAIPAERLAVVAVNPVVNNVKNKGPECLTPVATARALF